MKKIGTILLIALLILVTFAGCNKEPDNSSDTQNNQDVQNTQDKDTQDQNTQDQSVQDSQNTSDVQNNQNTDTASDTTTEEETPVSVELTVYSMNDNIDGYKETIVEVSEITLKVLLEQLTLANVLNEGTEINSFSKESVDSQVVLTIDFNDEFGNKIYSMGSSGEFLTVGSVVNTFLKAYEADVFRFTVNGEVFESGHVIYDEPLTFSDKY